MHLSRILFVSLTICAMVVCTGCTQNQASPVPVTPGTAPVPVPPPARLALTQSEMPQGFTIVESRAKINADVSKMALELGWQNGYGVRLTHPSPDGGEIEIVQSIAVYPARTIPEVIALADKQGRSDGDLTYTDLPVTGLGDNARAFFGKAGSQILINTAVANPVIDGLNTNQARAVSKNEVAEIFFSKGDTFEVFRMTGPSTDTALLIALAQKAYAKIP